MLGFLRTYKKIFPEATGFLSSEGRMELSRVENSLESCINEHIASKGGPNNWHNASKAIWNL